MYRASDLFHIVIYPILLAAVVVYFCIFRKKRFFFK